MTLVIASRYHKCLPYHFANTLPVSQILTTHKETYNRNRPNTDLI